MADPLSIGTGVVAVGGFLVGIGTGLDTLTRTYKNCPVTIQMISGQCSRIQTMMLQVKEALEQEHLDMASSTSGQRLIRVYRESYAVFRDQATQFEVELDKCRNRHDSMLGVLVTTVELSWNQSYLNELRDRFENQRAEMESILHCIQTDSLATLHTRLFKFLKDLGRAASGAAGEESATALRRPSEASSMTLLPEYSSELTALTNAIPSGSPREAKDRFRSSLGPNSHLQQEDEFEKGKYPLHAAAALGNVIAIERLLHRGADIDASDAEGRSPLMLALDSGSEPASSFLIDRGASLEMADALGQSALHVATRKGMVIAVVKILGLGANPNICDKFGYTPMWLALSPVGGRHMLGENLRVNAQTSSLPLLRALLSHGGNAYLATYNGLYTPIHHASSLGLTEQLQVLLQEPSSSASPKSRRPPLDLHTKNTEPWYSSTPLWLACKNCHAGCIRVLLEHGADPNLSTSHPRFPTPLAAAVLGHGPSPSPPLPPSLCPGAWGSARSKAAEAAAEILLTHGADPNQTLVGSGGHTLLHLIAGASQQDAGSLSLLLRSGGNPNIRDYSGFTPLHHAAAHLNRPFVRTLISSCTDLEVNAASTDGTTPLMIACQQAGPRALGLANLLITAHHAADVGATDVFGCDALFCACVGGDVAMVAYLLGYGKKKKDEEGMALVDVNKANYKGQTPLHASARKGWVDVVRLLLEMGADPKVRSKEAFSGQDSGVVGTAMDVARAAGWDEVVGVLEEWGEDC